MGRAGSHGNLRRSPIDTTRFANFSFQGLIPPWGARTGWTHHKESGLQHGGNVVTISCRDICRLTDATKCFINSF